MPQFQCGGVATRLPNLNVGQEAKLVVRVNDAASTAKVYFKKDPSTNVTVGNADGFLNAGESIEIQGEAVNSASNISFLDVSDNPILYWAIL